MRRPRALALCLLFLLVLAGCAAPGPAAGESASPDRSVWAPISPRPQGWVHSLPRTEDWGPMDPYVSPFLVPQAMAAHPIPDQPQVAITPMLRSEYFPFADGLILINHASPGTKVSEYGIQEIQDRGSVEAVLRAWVRRDDLLLDVISAQLVQHDAYPGDGWLITFRTNGHPCSLGMTFLSARKRRDATGMTFDTIVRAFFCHASTEVPPDWLNLFRRLRIRDG